ncbi:MAG: AAA family ATPase [bacterium]|nr:AAA family ATPase [bacterium]
MIYRFLDFELDEARFEIRRAGSPVLTKRRAFDFVRYLLVNRDRVVPQDELADSLWQGAVRGLSTIPQCVTSARRALGDDAGRQVVIQTVRGRGYRFVAKVLESELPSHSANSSVDVERAADHSLVPPFVGRSELMNTLRTAMRESLSGETRIVLLVGEAGIGKTRIVEELCREATDNGTTVLTGRCYDGEGAPAFWPWIQTVRDWVRLNEDKPIPEELAEQAGFFAFWRPELKLQFADLGTSGGEGAEARFQLFDAAARGLRKFAEHKPLVLVVEDLHWADPASLGLLSFVAAQLHHDPVLVLGTYREAGLHPAPELFRTLGELAREPTFRRLSVGGLETGHVTELIAKMIGGDIDAELSESVASMTEGNPFFVVELARILKAEGREPESGDLKAGLEIELPASISDAIGRRLGTLSSDSRKLLTLASVIGREFGTTLLSAAGGPAHDSIIECLEEAAAAGIIESARGAPDAYRFGHALIREALYQEVPRPNRARLHRTVAQALERLSDVSDTPLLAELAHHWYAAVATGEVEKAAKYCERAGQRALSRLAFEEAALHLRRALELADLRPSFNSIKRCELSLHLGQAEWSTGEQTTARATFARAAALAREADSAEHFARAAIGYYGFEEGHSANATIRALLDEAAEWIAEDSPALRACVLAKLQHLAPYAYSMRMRQSMSLEALRLARGCEDIEALREAFRARAHATPGSGSLGERLEWEEECREWGAKLDDPWLSWFGHDVVSPLSRGDRNGLLHALGQCARFGEAMPGNRLVGFVDLLQQSGFALMEGRFDDLKSFVPKIPEAGKNSVTWVSKAAFAYLFLERWETGKIDRPEQDLLPGFELTVAGTEDSVMLGHAGVALLQAFSGNRDAALSELDLILRPGFFEQERNQNWIYSMYMVAHAIERLQAKPRAEILYSALEPFADQIVCHPGFRCIGGSVASAMALISSVLGNFEAGEAEFDTAIRMEKALGAKPAALCSQAGLARLLLRRDAHGDRSRAIALMDEVVAGCSSLSIDPHTKYVLPFEQLL